MAEQADVEQKFLKDTATYQHQVSAVLRDQAAKIDQYVSERENVRFLLPRPQFFFQQRNAPPVGIGPGM
jgi:hypothetical protein